MAATTPPPPSASSPPPPSATARPAPASRRTARQRAEQAPHSPTRAWPAGPSPRQSGPTAAQRRGRAEQTRRAATSDDRQRVLTRKGLHALGWSDRAISHQVSTGRWRLLGSGVLLLTEDPPEYRQRLRAGWLMAGREAAVAGRAAAHLWRLLDEPPAVIDVLTPHRRTPARRDLVRIRRSRVTRQTRILDGLVVVDVPDTVVDLVEWSQSDVEAADWILLACSRRLTTPDRILAAARRRRRLGRRALLLRLCSRVAAGFQSWLEDWFDQRVVTSHGLPRGRRQVRRTVGGRVVYSDGEIDPYDTVVELDGRLGHEDAPGRHRDMARDNEHTVRRRAALRYGWRDSVSAGCAAAMQLAMVLTDRGWAGAPHPCGPGCPLGSWADSGSRDRPLAS